MSDVFFIRFVLSFQLILSAFALASVNINSFRGGKEHAFRFFAVHTTHRSTTVASWWSILRFSAFY